MRQTTGSRSPIPALLMVVHADMSERHDHYLGPKTGVDTSRVLDDAINSLGALGAIWVGDAGVDPHLLTSLLREAKAGFFG